MYATLMRLRERGHAEGKMRIYGALIRRADFAGR